MTHARPLAEQLADLVNELVDEVRSKAPITQYKTVSRGAGRTVTQVELLDHHTRDTGLYQQLQAIKEHRTTVPVKVYRWQPDQPHPDNPARCGKPGCKQARCAHGRMVHVRTEQRRIPGAVVSGAAVPGGSPGWDQLGALNPLRGQTFESRTPATTATDLHDDIRRGTDRLRRTLRLAAGKTLGARKDTHAALRELVGLLDQADDTTARLTLDQVRSWVTTARILLGYDAPIMALREVVCDECEGELRVRADASTAVWCAGHPAPWGYGPTPPGHDWGPVHYDPIDPCGRRYERGEWLNLIQHTNAPGSSR